MTRLNILGSEWLVFKRREEDDERLKENDGYCDWTTKKIVIREIPTGQKNSVEDLRFYEKTCLRHEIVHAFLYESGLCHNSKDVESWAMNEEMVDWIALQGQKIHKAWIEAGAING